MKKCYYRTYDEAFKGGLLLAKTFNAQPPYKDKHGWIIEYYEKELEKKNER